MPSSLSSRLRPIHLGPFVVAILALLIGPSLFAQSVNDGFDPNANGVVNAIALQPNGQAIVVGNFTTLQPNGASTPTTRNHIARVNPDGSLDNSFNPNANNQIYTVVLQPNGQILIGGAFTTIQANGASTPTVRNHIARLNSDGSLDTTFNPNAGGNLVAQVYAIGVQSNGQILIGGAFTTLQPNGAATATTRNHIARLNSDGSLDTTYNPNVNGTVLSIGMEPDGRAVIGGSFTTIQPNGAASASTRNYVARLFSDGTLDLGFDPNANGVIEAIAFQANGQILLGGNFTTLMNDGAANPTTRDNLARVNYDGTLDTAYNPAPSGQVLSIVLQPDGKALAAGSFTSLSPSNGSSATTNYVARINADGSIDSTFSPSTNGVVQAIALQSNGDVILGGNFTQIYSNAALSTTTRNNLARLDTDGTLDANFSGDSNGRVLALAQQPNGQILVGGTMTTIGGVTAINLARMNTNGTVDTSFAPVVNGNVTTIVIEPVSGQILIAGSFTSVNGVARSGFARLNTDGSLDTTFNPNPGAGAVRSIAIEPEGTTEQILIAGSFATIEPNGASTPTSENGIARLNEDGTLDTSFAPDPDGTVQAVAVMPAGASNAGQIVLVGNFTAFSPNGAANPTYRSFIARFNANGTLDTSWDPNANNSITHIAVQPNGAVIVSGSFTAFAPEENPNSLVDVDYVARINPDSSVDQGFAPDPNTVISNLAIEPNGQIIMVGAFTALEPYLGTAIYTRPYVVRINSNGSVDGSFVPNPNNSVNSVLALSDNSFYLGGGFTNIDGQASDHIAYFTAGGSLSTGFGLSSSNVTGSSVDAVAVQGNGDVVVAGSFSRLGGATGVNLARFNSDSTPDSTFNSSTDGAINAVAVLPGGSPVNTQAPGFAYLTANGGLNTSVTSNSIVQISGVVEAVAVQTNGQILLGGSFTNGSGVTGSNMLRLNADGTLDSSFNPNPNGTVSSIIALSTGQILIGGSFTSVDGTARNYIARLNSDGSLDSTFDPDANASVNVMVLQSNGQILIGGTFTQLEPGGDSNSGATTYTRYDIARLNAAGTVDTNFNPNANGAVFAIAVQSNGQILIGGSFTSLQPDGAGNNITRNNCARLNSDGSLDLTFDPEPNSQVDAIAVQSNGQVVLGGMFTTVQPFLGTTTATRTGIARVNHDGSLDTAYNPNINGTVSSLSLESNGEILVGGTFGSLQPNGALVPTTRGDIALLNTDGTVDPSFDPFLNGAVDAMLLQSNGSVILGGAFTSIEPNPSIVIGGSFAHVGTLATPYLALLGADGSVRTASTAAPNASVAAMALQSDGNLVIGGSFTSVGGNAANSLARINSVTGAQDTSYNPNVTGSVSALALQNDGQTIVGGSFTKVGSVVCSNLARVSTAGVADSTFTPVVNGTVNALVVQANGQILVGGSFTSIAGAARNNLARLNANGTIDTTFNPNVNGPVYSLVLTTLGQVVVGGSFSTIGGAGAVNIGRINSDGSVDSSFSATTDGTISAMAQTADGKLFLGGAFDHVNGQTRFRMARLSSDETAAQAITFDSGYTTITWTRSGNGPEISQVNFEYSTDDSTWNPILGGGTGTRVGTTTSWRLGGQNFSYFGLFYIRAVAGASNSQGGSTSQVLAIAQFDSATGYTGQALASGVNYVVTNTSTSSTEYATENGTILSGVNTAGNTATGTATAAGDSGSRLIAFSSNAAVGTGSPVVVGFTITGSSSKSILLRAVGPGLGTFGVTGTLADPSLTLSTSAGVVVATNSGWNNSTTVSTADAHVGAFPLVANSADAAIVETLSPGTYSMKVTSVSGGSGAVLAEVYDNDADPIEVTQQLSGSSTQAAVNSTNSLIQGFVIAGTTSQNVLVVGSGPALSKLGVSNPLAAPVLTVYDSQGDTIAQNVGWGTPETLNDSYPAASAASIATAASGVGAVTLTSGSADSAVLLTLQPGIYTAEVTGSNNSSGTALVEVYQQAGSTTTTTTTTSTSSSSSTTTSGGGGGAPSLWFYGSLGLLILVRQALNLRKKPV
jgi:uncharacterized delta-60 repeat protein